MLKAHSLTVLTAIYDSAFEFFISSYTSFQIGDRLCYAASILTVEILKILATTNSALVAGLP